ncbi:hypothetical protein PRUB_a4043 [Pseudoalteromonas rubra]|uniref:Uncharacterized protein n=2 Tax=Pseudoalteromonas rubra TaxID=43658 RepID=A0A8T0C905_9GAMM|nr:hypothetical protein [Pseudoalteromonas rubra]KAF7787169.1 hypothetical protein PRUB_a4043 [Pseudoalteromonas rubra]
MTDTHITPEQEKALIEGKEILASKQDALLQLGQIQAFNFIGKLVTVTELKIVQQIKDSKSYKGLTYHDENGKVVTVTTWEECCKHILNTDCQNIDRRLVNLQQFGEEFFEAAQNMKLGYNDLRVLRQLPEDDQALVIESEAVEAGDKDAVKQLIDDLKAKHQKEVDDLRQEVLANDLMLDANRKLNNENVRENQQLKELLHQRKFSPEKWKGDVKDFFEVNAKANTQILEGFSQLLVLNEQLETMELDEQTRHVATSAFYSDTKQLLQELAHVWNQLQSSLGHLDEVKPSGEWLQELGFDGAEEVLV